MQGDPRQLLEQQQSSAIREALEQLAKDPAADVAGLLKRIDAHDRLLAALPRRNWEWAKAAGVALLCLAALAGLWSFRLPRTSLSLVVNAETIAMTLTEPWSLAKPLPIGGATSRLDNLAAVDLPLINRMPSHLEDNAWLEIEGGQAMIESLNLAAGGTFILERDGGGITFYYSSADFTGTVALCCDSTFTAGDVETEMSPQTLHSDVPEVIAFSADRTWASISVVIPKPVSLSEINIGDLKFGRRETTDESGNLRFVSTITAGNLVLGDTGATVALERGDRLMLDQIEGRVRELRIAKAMTITFDGSVRRVVRGPEGAQVDLTPSLLDYLYHNSRLGFLWSSAVFMWGMLWSVRKLLFA